VSLRRTHVPWMSINNNILIFMYELTHPLVSKKKKHDKPLYINLCDLKYVHKTTTDVKRGSINEWNRGCALVVEHINDHLQKRKIR